MTRLRRLPFAAALLLTGCLVDRAGTRDDDAQVDTDAGPTLEVEAGVGEGGVGEGGVGEGGVDGGTDAGVEMQDGGPLPTDSGCTPEGSQCSGETLLSCNAGVLDIDDCAAAGRLCDPSLLACVDRVCVPGARGCLLPGGAQVCDARGAAWSTPTPCPRGCNGDVCRAETPCGDTVDAEISPGETIHLNLCDAAGTREHSDMHSNDCGGQPTGPDMLVRVNVAVGGRYRLLTSSDADPLIYLRRVCDDQDSQITCRDDNASNFNARITRDFSAGDHFLVVDQYLEGDGTGCGELNLSFQPM